MRIRFKSPDLEQYVRQLRRVDPRTLQTISGEALRPAAEVYKQKLKALIDFRHTRFSAGRRKKLSGTIRSRLYTKASYAPNAVMIVYARVEKRTDRNQAPAGLRLLWLDKGTKARYTSGDFTTVTQTETRFFGGDFQHRTVRRRRRMKAAHRGKIDATNIVQEARLIADPIADVVIDQRLHALLTHAIRYRKR